MPRRPPRRVLNVLDDITSTPPSTLEPSQSIARIASAQGRDCFRVILPSIYTPALEVADPKNVLVELASEFRGKTWMRRGGYVLVDLAKRGKKIEGEIVNVVREEKEWRAMPYWWVDIQELGRKLVEGMLTKEQAGGVQEG